MELKAQKRDIFGKKVKQMRLAGSIPAELFGKGIENEHVSVSEKEFTKVYRTAGEHELVTVAIEGGKKMPVLIAEAKRDPLTQSFLSVDFYAVRMDEKIRVNIPLSFVGESPVIKLGLPIIKVMDELEIETLPGKMPHAFEVNLALLDAPGASIHVKDLAIPKDVKIFLDSETVVATVGEKTKEEVAPAPVESAVPAPEAAPAAKEESK